MIYFSALTLHIFRLIKWKVTKKKIYFSCRLLLSADILDFAQDYIPFERMWFVSQERLLRYICCAF